MAGQTFTHISRVGSGGLEAVEIAISLTLYVLNFSEGT